MTMENPPETISVSLPPNIIDKVEELQRRRSDPTRSDTIRVLLLHALAEHNLLSPEEEEAMGIKRPREAGT
jgi:metal-responsive CopG/Arc/MetJ family transcriptional regulator